MPEKISAKSSWSVGQSPKPQWVQIPKRNISTYQLVTGLVKQTLRVKIDLEQASSSGAGMPSQRQAGTTSWLTRLPPKPIKSTNLDRAASKRIFVNLILLILCIACSDVFTLQYHGSMANKQNGICTTTKDKYILWRDMSGWGILLSQRRQTERVNMYCDHIDHASVDQKPWMFFCCTWKFHYHHYPVLVSVGTVGFNGPALRYLYTSGRIY